MIIPFNIYEERTFRTTESVHFADIGIPGSNGLDLVRHTGAAVSPPHKDGNKQFYVHQHQTDNNRVLVGSRLFELVCFDWECPRWFVYLTPDTGALEIPPGCLHRSCSCKEGSVLINQAVRGPLYNESTEFIPVAFDTRDLPPPSFYNITELETVRFIQHRTLS